MHNSYRMLLIRHVVLVQESFVQHVKKCSLNHDGCLLQRQKIQSEGEGFPKNISPTHTNSNQKINKTGSVMYILTMFFYLNKFITIISFTRSVSHITFNNKY